MVPMIVGADGRTESGQASVGAVRHHVARDGAGIADQAVDQLAITQTRTMPARGSIRSQPSVRASSNLAMTRTDTAAFARTWMIAARMLLSR